MNKVDPKLLRRIYAQFSNIDPGANPQFADIPALLAGTGLSLSIPYVAPGKYAAIPLQTAKQITAAAGQACTNATTPTIYTVSANKTLYVSHIILGTTTALGSAGTVQIQDATGNVAGTAVFTIAYDGTTPSIYDSGLIDPPLKYTAGLTFNTGIGTTTVYYTIVGWEE